MAEDEGATIEALGLTVDLGTDPWRYPGPLLPFSCLQIDNRLQPLHAGPDRELLVSVDGRRESLESHLWTHHGTRLDECHLVVAIGCNASPDVLRRKLDHRQVRTTVTQVVGRLDGFSIGHSAHVSPAGYVPVTAFPRDAASTPVIVSLLTEELLLCIDETEPNYNRTTVPSDRVRLALPLPLPADVHMYQSKWGVIVDAEGEPLTFDVQEAIFLRLSAWGALPPELPAGAGVAGVTRALREDPEARTWITNRLAAHAVPVTGSGSG